MYRQVRRCERERRFLRTPKKDGSNGLWERDLIFQFCLIGVVYLWILLWGFFLVFTPESLQTHFGGVFLPLAPFVELHWKLIWTVLWFYWSFRLSRYSEASREKAYRADPVASMGRHNDRVKHALWRRLIIT